MSTLTSVPLTVLSAASNALAMKKKATKVATERRNIFGSSE
jgi:hypothetical protein